MSLDELEQEPFSVHDFVERLAWKTMGSKARNRPEDFDPLLLHAAFEKMIKDLRVKNVQMQGKIEKLEGACKEEEKRHWQRVAELQKKNQGLYSNFQKLDERINYVATKVVHLGDQLEGVNTPRARAVEAQRLMNYLNEFLSDEPLKSPVFTDPSQLQLAADIIQKLHLIALELPVSGRFDRARQRIADKYDQIEKELIGEFKHAHKENNIRMMKRIANVLQNFKAYGQCIDIFIAESQVGAFLRPQIFDDVVPLCEQTRETIQHVFSNPDMVMGKFVQNIFQGRIQNHVSQKLQDTTDLEKYLNNLFDLYSRATKLAGDLSSFKLGNESAFLNKLVRGIFNPYLESYIDIETRFLRERCQAILQRYYDQIQHQKRQIQSGGIHDLRREFQAKLGTKANINIGPTIEDYGGQTFLSQEAAINILQETKSAFKRCEKLLPQSEHATNAMKIAEVLIQYLVMEHIDYAIEIGLHNIPLADCKAEPKIYFFDVINQANSLFHLFEKQYIESFLPLVQSSQRHGSCLKKKKELREQLEGKIDTGLDRAMNTIMGWVRYLLQTEQKKTDFKPETEDLPMVSVTPACSKVVKFMSVTVRHMRDSLDGKNVDITVLELGHRFHRCIFEHLQQFQYNSIGAMLAICDVNEYRKCAKEGFKHPHINELFDRLHALSNLLVVVPENLKDVRNEEQLADLEEAIISNWVQLRVDYRAARIATHMK